MAVHRFVLRERQDGHWRHSGVYSGITWSPFLTDVTPGPTSTTTPAPSWPRIAGKIPSGSAPESVNSSVWQIPVAFTSTRTSPSLGPARSTSMISSGFPAATATAARVFISDTLASQIFSSVAPLETRRVEPGRPFAARPAFDARLDGTEAAGDLECIDQRLRPLGSDGHAIRLSRLDPAPQAEPPCPTHSKGHERLAETAAKAKLDRARLGAAGAEIAG